jgi:hypothetical protein
MQLTVPVLVHPADSEVGGVAAGDRSRQAARIISPCRRPCGNADYGRPVMGKLSSTVVPAVPTWMVTTSAS